jgi:putative peptidoglycan lipid II flippase
MGLEKRRVVRVDDEDPHRTAALTLQFGRVTTPRSAGRLTKRSASFIGSMTLAGRVVERLAALGQIVLVAAFLGATTQADLYFIASIVPLMIGGLLGEAFYASILPPLSRRRGREEMVELAAAGFWAAAVALVLVTGAYLVVATVVVSVAKPAGSEDLAPWFAFAPIGILFALGAYAAAVLLRLERYSWPPFRSAASAVVGLALTAIALSFTDSVLWIALAVSAGYAAALVLLIAELLAVGGGGMFRLPTQVALRELLPLRGKVVASVAGGLLGGQVFVFLERLLAASLGVGAVAAISYSRGVAFTPNVLAQSISLGLYPGMLRAHAERNIAYLRGSFVAGLRVTLFIAAAAASYIAWFAPEIARFVFDRGDLPDTSVVEIGRALRAFSLALVASMVLVFTARVFNALDYFRAIVWSQGAAVLVYVVLAPVFRPWQGPTGLALALGIAESTAALLAIAVAWRRIGSNGRPLLRMLGWGAMWRIGAIVGAVALCESAFEVAEVGSDGVVVLAGFVFTAAAAAVLLWSASWAELDGARSFVRRHARLS